ncbi:MAG TPA: DUF4837 family protein [Longimicrobiales bacterium]|nr:DUF4837 family protein [Longimicrobiales bacterium]
MRTRRNLAVLAVLLTVSACDRTGAYGDASSIILGAEPELWAEVEESVHGTLEPTIQTVREERTFTVTHQDPTAAEWARLRQFKQMLVVGTADDPWVAEALNRARGADEASAPQILQARDVWARAQLVTVLLLPETGQAEAVRSLLPELQEIYDRQFRQLALDRMFVSGRDSALIDTLRAEAGFSLLLPQVYYWDAQDSVFLFRNDNPDPSELIRQVAVTWRTPIPQDLEGEEILAWREQLAADHYAEPQLVDLSDVAAGPFDFQGHSAYQVQAVWQNTPEANWPAAGPFILRAVACPAQDRLYLLDGWLYAPGKEKYEYMIQLETILDSFACGG